MWGKINDNGGPIGDKTEIAVSEIKTDENTKYIYPGTSRVRRHRPRKVSLKTQTLGRCDNTCQ